MNKYAKIDIYLSEKNCTVIIMLKIHIVENLRTKMLVNMNILMSKDIIMNLFRKLIIINSCENIEIFFTIIIKLINQIKQTILIKHHIVVSSHTNIIITVILSDLLLNCDFLFKLNCCYVNVIIYVYIVDHVMTKIHIYNNNDVLMIISHKFQIRKVIEYKIKECY